MEPNSLMWVGSPCGLHGPYIFYKAFRFHLEAKPRILSLGDFFLVRCKPGEPLCIAELQLLWEERTSKQLLSSSKLYFLPEDTPKGRTVSHGEDEIVAVSEKVVVKLEDLVRWTARDSSAWNRGLKARPLKPHDVLRELGKNGQRDTPLIHRYRESTLNCGLNFKDVLKEKAEIGDDADQKRVLVLSYPQYCRYRSVLARLRERPASLLTSQVVLALGGVASLTEHTHILYCRDTFEHPSLIDNDSVCDGFAPNLKGRPRKKKLSVSQRRDSQNAPAGKETCSTEGKSPVKVKTESKPAVSKGPKVSNNATSCKRIASSSSLEENIKGGPGDGEEECRADEQAFLVALYQYMKERKTPIERIPYLGFKQINLWTMFQAAEKLGGYEQITARRQWKNVYDELGGNPGSTSAATCTRRHYERLILPYERFTKGEDDKPLPPAKPRKDSTSQDGAPRIKVSPLKQRPKEEQPLEPSQMEQDPTVTGLEPLVKCDERERSPLKKEVQLKQDEEPPQFSTLLAGESIKKRSFSTEDGERTVQEETVSSCLEMAPLLGHSLEKNEYQPLDPTTLSEADNVFPRDPPTPPDHAHPPDQLQIGPKELPGYADPTPPGLSERPQGPNRDPGVVGTVGTVLPMMQQKPLQPTRVPEGLNDRAEISVPPGDSSYSHTPLVYPGRTQPGTGINPGTDHLGIHPGLMNPGIMSPLAKKKLLSQVSGTVPSLPNHYAFGPPPPLINTGPNHGNQDELAGQPVAICQGSATDTSVVKRPSVIQHAQSFKPPTRKPMEREREGVARDLCGPGEPYTPSDLTHRQTIHHPQAQHLHPPSNCPGDTYLLRPEPHPHQAPRPGHTPSFLSDYYSSPHLHNLYRHPETRLGLGQEPLGHYVDGRERETGFPRDCEATPGSGGPAFSPSRHPETMGLGSYCSHVTSLSPSMASHNHTHRGHRSPGQRVSDDQPTDLSLPKPSPRKPSPSLHGPPTPLLPQDTGRFCRVPPRTVSSSSSRKLTESQPNPREKALTCRVGGDEAGLGGVYKMDELNRPILGSKNTSSTQNVCTARPLKRSLGELENGPPERKIRAVTPMHSSSSCTIRDRDWEREANGLRKVQTPDLEGEVVKPQQQNQAQTLHQHANTYMEGHKVPLHPSSLFPGGLYPGALVSQIQDICEVPPGYHPYPLQYLKNPSVLSPLVPPFAIHSFMMQRQLLAQAAHSPAHMYRHPMGGSYGELLHHGLYPVTAMSALNAQQHPAFGPSQLSSIHPSTKLS
ncbi:hypothetical protein DPEC_G00032130 [Dallia pectoralis]|uniref:Uncharacterized protein n=1 Tax=Dallia pectoralis TaxID=75939 RepID=A0ACC2HD23_DALPE|nr:hypothetical protein DPEC_G00032130 [Dallia pectoralis]